MNVTGWSRGWEVTADGEGIVSHAGLVLLRGLADRTGLTGGVSRALAGSWLLVHDRGRVAADLACAIAGGARAISDVRVVWRTTAFVDTCIMPLGAFLCQIHARIRRA